MSFLWAIGGFLLVLTPVVLIHELGHFTAAKLSKIRVEEFGFGLPPRALTLAEKGGTIYSLNWIPLGGFVRPAGEDDPTIPGGFASASKHARFFVLVSGAAANFLFALVLFWIALMIRTTAIEVASVSPESPAMIASLQVGDVLLAVDGEEINKIEELQEIVGTNAGNEIELLISRDGQELTVNLTPRLPNEYDASTDGPLGVSLFGPMGPGEAAVNSANFMWDNIVLTLKIPSMLLSGEVSPEEARPISVVGISQIAGQAAEASASRGSVYPLFTMAAIISIALGLTNLLPIPALDGGRILFVLIEAVRGRRIEPERESMVHVIGMLVLLVLMVFLIFQDIINPIVPPQ
ncbi:MAG: M50 family metallopeptidase [Candidatus Promineifilaceae bacterium]|jgi:regulator of sigma E protease